MQSTIEEIHQHLGDLVFGEGDQELQDIVIRDLAARAETMSTLEMSTEGVLAHWLAAADDANASQAYAGGVVCHADHCGQRYAGSAAPTSREFAMQAAQRVREEHTATLGLALGRFPSDGSFWIGLATANEVTAHERSFAGHPDILIERSAKQALDIVRRQLRQRALSIEP